MDAISSDLNFHDWSLLKRDQNTSMRDFHKCTKCGLVKYTAFEVYFFNGKLLDYISCDDFIIKNILE